MRLLRVILITIALAGVSGADPGPMEVIEAPPLIPVQVFERVLEPREAAFSYLKPYGWEAVGGIVRRDPLAVGVNTELVAPKLDFMIRRDSLGSAMIQWRPNTTYCDISRSPMADAGLFPTGSTYQGMPVQPRMSAQEFLLEVVVKSAHPTAGRFELIEQRPLPELAAEYQQRVRALPGAPPVSYDAATLTVAYEESGVTYIERWMTVIEDLGITGGGQWSHKETLCFRAPAAEFEMLESVFSIVHSSIMTNPAWIANEVMTEAERGSVSLATREEQEALDRGIVEHRKSTNEHIHASVFLSAEKQPEVLNPFTGQLETGSTMWPHRWINANGTVVYAVSEEYNPNTDPALPGHGFRLCEAAFQTGSRAAGH